LVDRHSKLEKAGEGIGKTMTYTSASMRYNKEKYILLEPDILIFSISLCPFFETLILGQ